MPLEVDEKTQFLLLYASQTGQAKAIAEEIADNCSQYDLVANIHCMSMTEKRFWLDREKCVVIVSSTAGDGEPPDTAQKFFRRLKKKTLPRTHLQHLSYTLLGLGDTNYTNFCNCGKAMKQRLDDLGANVFYPCGWADDAMGLEIVVEPWMDGLFKALCKQLGIVTNIDVTTMDCPSQPVYVNIQSSTDNTNSTTTCINSTLPASDNNTPVTSNHINSCSSSIKDFNDTSQQIESKSMNVLDDGSSQTEINKDNVPMQNCSQDLTEDNNHNKDGTSARQAESGSADKRLSDPSNSTVFIQKLRYYTGLAESALSLPICPIPFLNITFHTDQTLSQCDSSIWQNGAPLPSAASEVFAAPLLRSNCLTSDKAVKTALLLELDLQDCDWSLEPGDSFGVICSNPLEEVNRLIERLGESAHADCECELSVLSATAKRAAAVPKHYPSTSTIRQLLSTCCDIRAVPKKAFIRAMVEHTTDPEEKRRLQELCSKQGSSHYTAVIREPSLCLQDILHVFPSCQPPIGCILEHLPRLQPRPYSTASCHSSIGRRIRFVFNVVDIAPGDERAFHRGGICTSWLQELSATMTRPAGCCQHDSTVEETMKNLSLSDPPKISIYLRSHQSFHPPTDLSVPYIMIGPGTGVAPFVGFLQHRSQQIRQRTDISDGNAVTAGSEVVNSEDMSCDNETEKTGITRISASGDPVQKSSPVGETWLFYGCRHIDHDYLFRQEFEQFVTDGVLSQLSVSFSRQPETDSPRYVQDSLKTHGQHVTDLIYNKSANIYICGDASNMAKNVNQTFVDILQKHKGMTEKEAESYLMTMRLEKRYLQDVWT